MNRLIPALKAEALKNRHSKIIRVTFLAIALAPVFGGIFMLLMKGNGYDGLSGAFRSKAILMSFEASWNSYLGLLSQAVGVGGVLILGFAASWLFGREYAEGTMKDLLALPVSRTDILNAKFLYFLGWSLALVIFNLLAGLLIGLLLKLPGWTEAIFIDNLKIYFITAGLILLLNTPVAFVAIAGKGYLTPLGLVAIALVLSQIIGALGFGQYFPWAVPGIYSGSGGSAMKDQLSPLSYILVFLTGIAGYVATIAWLNKTDQPK